MTMNIRPTPSPRRTNALPDGASWFRRASAAGADLEFGRFRVLLRRRQLLADGVPVELGTRAFDLLLVLLEADGALVTKEELLSRVWPGIIVTEENVKLQISTLRKALGVNRDVIHTQTGRGYRFVGVLRVNNARPAPDSSGREKLRSASTLPSRAIPGTSPGRGVTGWAHRCPRSIGSVHSAAFTDDGSSLETIRRQPR